MRTTIAFAAGLSAAIATTPTANVTAGTLVGGTCSNNPQAVYFKSVPFAQPPIGDLRFAAPQPYTQRYDGGSRNATYQAASCFRFGSAFLESNAQSEDCLYLNVWAPANTTDSSALPVRVWVFGGSNSAGDTADPMYDGCNVPKTNAIMVALSYRVGPLGFLAVKDSDIGGNQAIQDIILGLQWVQDNIASFGGDPKKVVLTAQSSGALNSFTVSTLPQAPKLFSAVIVESGGGRDQPSIERGHIIGQAYADAFNCSTSDSKCLRTVPVSALQSACNNARILNEDKSPALGVNTIDDLSFGPFVDGKIVPDQPSKVGVNVPAIFGSNAEDAMLFSLVSFPYAPQTATVQDYTQFLRENFGSATPQIEQQYPLSAFNASSFPAFTAMGQVMTDAPYLCTAYRGAKTALAKNFPVSVYQFSHHPKCDWISAVPENALPLIGATHTCEIPFILGNTEKLPQPGRNCTMSPDERSLSSFMSSACTHFAATQQPTSDKTAWPLFGGADNTVGVIFANTTVVGKIAYSVCEALWDKVYADEVTAANNGSYAGAGTGTRANLSDTSATSPPANNLASSVRASTLMIVSMLIAITNDMLG